MRKMKNIITKIAEEIVKEAGTWSLPDSQKKINKLEEILINLRDGGYIKDGPSTALSEILGDDQLFDKIDHELHKAYVAIYPYVRAYIIQLIDDYEKNPANFRKIVDTNALRKLI